MPQCRRCQRVQATAELRRTSRGHVCKDNGKGSACWRIAREFRTAGPDEAGRLMGRNNHDRKEPQMRRKMLFRQGDVLLVPVAAAPGRTRPVPREQGRIVLAHGEATGHAHAIVDESAELVSAGDAQALYLLVYGLEVDLVHEEHDTVTLPGGTAKKPAVYEVRRQREYTPKEIRQVAD